MKKINIILLIALSILISGCGNKQPDPVELSNMVFDKLMRHTSISYDIEYKIKHLNSNDTTKIFTKIDLIRDTNDTVFGGYFWIDIDSIKRFYNTKNIYSIYDKEKEIVRFKKNETFAITNKTDGNSIETYFLNPNRLTYCVNDTANTIKLSVQKNNNEEVYVLHCDFPQSEYFESMYKEIYIDKLTYNIVKIAFFVKMQGETQYNEWNLSNIIYDKITKENLEKRFLEYKNKYKIEDFKLPVKRNFEPLPIGSSFPNFEGIEYKTDKKISFRNFKGEMVLLDFWYMDCFPCIKAIPHLNKLFNKYSGKGLRVLGVNPVNNNEKDLKRLPRFLEYNNIDYPIIFIKKEQTAELKVNAFPTLYLIDKKAKVLYSTVGFDEKEIIKIDSIIEKTLNSED